MVPWGCIVNPIVCGIQAATDSGDSGDDTDGAGSYVCNNGLLNFIPATSGATIILDQVCDTNNSIYTNGDFTDTIGGVGAGIMEMMFGENWATYMRIILGLIVLSVLSKIRNLVD